jgi:hypothetical protein
MDYRSAYIRRSRKGSHLKKRLAVVGLLGVAACASLFALTMRESATPAASAQAPAETATLAPAVLRTAAQVEAQEQGKKTRRVYPYSIVPGGLADRRELQRAVVMDKVVAEHYAAFETGKATVKTVDKPRAVYVSYRKGDQVFWTSKKLQLAQGETLLSDGQNEIRTRCGNRISDVPRLPVEAKGPTEEELDAAVDVEEDGDGTVAPVGFSVDSNPAGHGYQLQTFGSGTTPQNQGTHPARGSLTLPPPYNIYREPIENGPTLALATADKVSVDPAGTKPPAATPPAAVPPATDTPAPVTPPAPAPTTETPPPVTPPTVTPPTVTPPAPVPTTVTPPPRTPVTNPPKPGKPTPVAPVTPVTPVTPVIPVTPGDTPDVTPPVPAPDKPVAPPTPTDLPNTPIEPVKPPVQPPAKPHGTVPEPGTLWLAGAGVAALLGARRAKKRARK